MVRRDLGVHITWTDVDRAVEEIARKIEGLQKEGLLKKYTGIYGIPRGGLIPAVMLSHRLNIPMCAIKEFIFSESLSNILVVDDIADSGKTLLPYDKLDLATLFVRLHTTEVVPDYCGFEITHDKWLYFPWEQECTKRWKERTTGER